MATRLQKKLAQAIANEDPRQRPKQKKELLLSVGYAESTAARKAGEILRQKGVKEELMVLGFSEVEADSVVAQILHNPKVQPTDRLRAANLVYERLGSKAPKSVKLVGVLGEVELKKKDKAKLNALLGIDEVIINADAQKNEPN